MKNPWTTLSSQQQYNNNWIEVTEHQILNPNGNAGIYGVVHFKNIAVGAIPLDSEGYTWLVGQYRYPLNEYSWEIPEGGCPIGKETPLETAQRELLEETGLSATRWTELLKIHTSNSTTDETGYIFVAQDLTLGEWQPEDSEQLQLRRVHFSEVWAMAMRGEITDSLSLAGIFKLKFLLDTQQI